MRDPSTKENGQLKLTKLAMAFVWDYFPSLNRGK